jgi:tyrosyl-tRNA synthetase
LTALVHGEQAANDVEAAALALFGGGDLRGIAPGTLGAALAETPSGWADRRSLPTMTELMVAAGLVDSKGAARRAIAEGGAYLNNERISDADHVPTEADLVHGRWLVLRRGKRTVASIDTASN